MARDVHQTWDDEDISEEDDRDDAPILSYRYDKQRKYPSYTKELRPERERRWAVTLVAKCTLFSTAMILFCCLLYIPVYNRANYHVPKVAVAGWSIHSNRDTKIYVQPDNVTTIHEPKDICPKANRNKKNSLFLLIVVCSSTVNFEQRVAIRETWGSYKNYLVSGKLFNSVREKYKDYNYTYDLYEELGPNVSLNLHKLDRRKRDISGYGKLLPQLAEALKHSFDNEIEQNEDEKRFEDEKEEMLPEFDMNKELGEPTDEVNFDYDYESNVMKIPPRGYEDDHPDIDKILEMLKSSKNFPKKEILEEGPSNTEVDFKVVFLLGMSAQENDTEVQDKIDEEFEKYGDVIQEGFIDSYNNLTLKSIMLLKWVTNNCNESVRYILKTDDDMYINVPSLILNLRNRSKTFDSDTTSKDKEYLLIGDLICGAKPVLDSSNKWYSPRYMYGGRVYPRYLSGTGYVFSSPAAHALYAAALSTHYFHLEDVFITGICSLRAKPRVTPRDEPGFSYAVSRDPCAPYARHTTHHVSRTRMRDVAHSLRDQGYVDKCERIRLTQVRKERLKPKPTKKLTKIGLPHT